MRKTRRRRALFLASFVLAVALVLMASSPAWAALLKAADWRMNETSGQMRDSSGNGNNGIPTDVVQGVQEEDGKSTYVFNGSTSYVFVRDADSLDPGGKDINLRASVRVNGGSLDETATTSCARASLLPMAATTRWR